MAKACDCGAILEAFETDPRLMALPLAVRGLWLALVLRMRRMGQSALVFGSVVPNLREIAMLVPCEETELETQLPELLARGLLVRRSDGALESPLLAARMKRAETARINGLKGGRPRKDGQPSAQRTLMMPIPGGLAEAETKTQPEPVPVAVGSPAKLSQASQEKPKPADLPPDWQRICDAAMEAAGFDPVRWPGNCNILATWLRAGASEALILSTIRRVMAHRKQDPLHFGFFKGAIEEALAAERSRQAEPVTVSAPGDAEREERSKAYQREFHAWKANGMVGPAPIWGAAA